MAAGRVFADQLRSAAGQVLTEECRVAGPAGGNQPLFRVNDVSAMMI